MLTNKWLRVLASFIVLVAVPTAGVAQAAKTGAKSGTKSPAKSAASKKAEGVDAEIAAAVKAVSAKQIQATIEKLVSFGTRNTLSSQDPEMLAKGQGIIAARNWIQSEFERYSKACDGCLEVKLDTFTEQPMRRIPVATELNNVYAVMKGTDPESAKRIYLVTGHYDSINSDTLDFKGIAPGANDDASGTAVSLECARVLSQHKFPATIIFLTVAGEEQGLNGSRHFAKMAKAEGWTIAGVLNNDIVGGNKSDRQDTKTVRVFSEGIPLAADEAEMKRVRSLDIENDSASRQLARYARETGMKYLGKTFQAEMMLRRDRYLRGGDHTAFNENGFAAVRFTEYREEYTRQHQNIRTENGIDYGDLPKWVDFAYVANVARVNAATLASLASAPAPPANVKLVTRRLENDTQLTWGASPDGEVVGYEVVWRPTTSAEWVGVEPVGTETKATIDRSKDNVVFAVRAVGKKGNRSVTVLPTPER